MVNRELKEFLKISLNEDVNTGEEGEGSAINHPQAFDDLEKIYAEL